MAHVRSTTRPCDSTVAEGECAMTERGVVDECQDSIGSAKRTESAHVSDVSSQSHAEGNSDGGSRICSCYFGPSTIIVSCIREMIDQGYFAEGGACALSS
jgi:hypothetical protein